MLSFISVVIAALIGAMLAPYFSHFLTKKKARQDEILKYLEESYLLASKIDTHARNSMVSLLFITAALKNQISLEKIPKLEDEPFSRLCIILDFHLNAPSDLINQIRELHKLITLSNRPIAETLNKTGVTEKDDLFFKAANEGINAIVQASLIQDSVINWIKAEKFKLEQVATFFEKKYWANVIDKIKKPK